jgi:hypothetical protein
LPTSKSNDPRKFSYLSALYSPAGFLQFREKVIKLLERVKNDDNKYQFRFVKYCFGETYKIKETRQITKTYTMEHESYEVGTRCQKGAFLTMGVNVQGDRIEGKLSVGVKVVRVSPVDIVFVGDTEMVTLLRSQINKQTSYDFEE